MSETPTPRGPRPINRPRSIEVIAIELLEECQRGVARGARAGVVDDTIAVCRAILEQPRAQLLEVAEAAAVITRDLTIRELQSQLPWTVHYHRDFRASPMTHKDFGHALLHVFKAAGKLASVVNDAEHGGSEFKPEDVDRYVADMVVCALRMATTCPGRQIDLQRAVEERIEVKNEAELQRVPQ
jgi:hypothetical protein